jgi:hypothetical protein
MTEPTAAQCLIMAFEQAHPYQPIHKEDIAVLAKSLGGDPEAVHRCQFDTSILAYLCALTVRHIEENQPAIHHRIQFPTNVGHGHVFSRPDGVRARCGGPGMCDTCNADAFEKIGR